MHGVKSNSAEKAEVNPPTSGNSQVEPNRPSLKRKHENDSSTQPQCRVLQMPNSEDLTAEPERTPTSVLPSSNSMVRDIRGNIVPFKCNFCNTCFISQSGLQSHISTDHKRNELEIYARLYFVRLYPKPKFTLQCTYNALVAFYEHFCKFHLEFEHSPALNALITIPHLVQKVVKRNRRSNQQAECPAITEIEKCRMCDFETSQLDAETISEHLRTAHRFHYWHVVEPGEIWQCSDCQSLSASCLVDKEIEKYFVKFHFKNIIITKSYSSKLQNAPFTGVSFKYKFDELLPVYKHEPKTYSCTVCPATFETQSQLDLHLETHVDFVFRKCSVCQWKCYNMDEYYNHVYEAHGSCLMPDVDFRNKKAQVCHKSSHFTVSNAVFLNRCSLHIRICHQSKFNSKSIVKLQCPVCDVVFLDTKLFYSHCVPYTKIFTNLPWKCIACRLNFNTENDARTHWKVHSESELLFCKICKLRQNSVHSLENHVSKQHNIPMIHCHLCKTNLLYTKNALDHFKSCYSKSSHFICLLCGCICEDVNFFITHMRVELETLLPRYQCKTCLNYFYGKVNLVSHMLHGKCK